ncbi:4-hydroxythreonine-4-phosphate dehydrogenase PdxA [Kiloniella laminariae]|uniref:4-hydroxythreonine-4-phosphate dehydrogenase n=1 Tax=Kiloniella laminariae TaxID=454162 RepID=A0ABT4LH02_9PROT|nr:4-hydroxythreonine-4-phosphate dehydrogenase PdxA [Kiloniella laminariae]MCZ4280385.1 4-hydroxythreonine-4-phosphate dehydrogenase PdxA [Kiloniella laminariae]
MTKATASPLLRPSLPLALTMGEPAGIGGELTLKAWLERRHSNTTPFFAIDDIRRLEVLAAQLGLAVPVKEIAGPEEAAGCFAEALPVLSQKLSDVVISGQVNPANGKAVLGSIERAVELVRAGRAAAVVTNPINKAALYDIGFKHPGHTEYLADLAGISTPSVMMLACAQLRVVPVTIHLSLAQAIKNINQELLTHTIRTTHRALQDDFGIAAPRLAVSGLNPHAGENGSMGREEIELIIPTLELIRKEGLDLIGPLPADTMFHASARKRYDVAICMYHDQALIPIKTLDFDGGVNITLGLPFIRTSPDHGTAFDIAGKGIANPASLLAALDMAAEMAKKTAGKSRHAPKAP